MIPSVMHFVSCFNIIPPHCLGNTVTLNVCSHEVVEEKTWTVFGVWAHLPKSTSYVQI